MMSFSANKGFSLIEVLVAMVVFALSVMALSGSISSTFKTQTVQKDRTFAHYVALRRLAEVKLKSAWPNTGTTRGELKMFNRDWGWKQEVSNTTDKALRRVEVAVSSKNDEEYYIAKVTAFLGKP